MKSWRCSGPLDLELPDKVGAVSKVVHGFPCVFRGRIPFPFHKIIRLSANSFEIQDCFCFIFCVFVFFVSKFNVCLHSRVRMSFFLIMQCEMLNGFFSCSLATFFSTANGLKQSILCLLDYLNLSYSCPFSIYTSNAVYWL